MSPTAPSDVMGNYFDCWRDDDTERFRTILADDVTFEGPLATVAGADEYAASIKGLFAITADIVIEKMWADGADVLTWFQLHTKVAEPTPVASWGHVEDGLVRRVRVTFDPRGLAP